jgi:3-oxoacid CoA-transferase subunit A
MATAAKFVIAEVEEIVENGEIDPECVHTPGVYVDRIFKGDAACPFSEKLIEKLTVRDHSEVKKHIK